MDPSEGVLASFAKSVGSSEDALRLLIALLSGYPIAYFHRSHLFGKSSLLQYSYFVFTGFSIGWFCFGSDMIHPVSAVAISYAILAFLGGGTLSLTLVFVYTMLHLLIGYWVTATGDYDIKWTMPQCVITLRLIGLAFNLSDGTIPEENLSKENKTVALREMPGLLEVFAHNFYPGSFLIGPQLPLIRLRKFVHLELQKDNKSLPDSIRPGLLRGLLGVIYLAIHLIGASYVTDDSVTSEEFDNLAMWKKYLIVGLWGRIALYKYISCWLLTEGSCIVMGLTYNGEDEAGVSKWDSCSNVKISIFETATKMDHYIESFNVNTNHWVAQYIYKRLKFLNNKMFSQMGVLLFLAVWHGFHSGYYATFFIEFLSIVGEKEIITLLKGYPTVTTALSAPVLKPLLFIALRIYTFCFMGYAMIPFILLKQKKYMPVLASFYFLPHIILLLIVAAAWTIPKRRREKEN